MPCGHLPPKVAKRSGGVNRNERWARPALAAKIEVADLRALQTSRKVFVSSLAVIPSGNHGFLCRDRHNQAGIVNGLPTCVHVAEKLLGKQIVRRHEGHGASHNP